MLYFNKNPKGTGIKMTVNFKKQTVFKGHASQAIIALYDNGRPIFDAKLTLCGAKSGDTKIYENRVIVGKDETSDELVLEISKDGETERVILEVKEPICTETPFDDDNIILTFALTSDTHVSGSWNQPRSVAKLVHFLETVQKAVGRNPDGTTKLNAVTCAGDFVDAVNSYGNVNGGVDAYGYKGAQNYREVSFIRSVLEGRETNFASDIQSGKPAMDADFGKGLEDGVEFFYCLGNHDESGRGMAHDHEKYTTVHTAKYFTAVFCGWSFDLAKTEGTPDFCDSSYKEYADDLLAIKKADSSERAALISAFTEKHGVDGEYAFGRFEKYYGKDTEYTCEERGLFYGNRHTVINGIHFIAIETSQCAESAEYLDKWCAQSVLEDEKKPIFVMTHEKVYHTIDSSVPEENCPTAYMSVPGRTGLLSVLSKYPQVFIFTGHTHSVLTNANSIMSDCGFTAVEGSVLAYLSCEGLIGRGETPAGNFCRKEEHNSGPCLIVKVDKSFGVKIEKLDAHRSYSEASGHPDEAVYFGEPWVITGLSSSGEHLLKYGIERSFDENNAAPVFPENAKASVTYSEDGKLYVSFPAAQEDGSDIVKYYKIELENLEDETDRPWQFATSFGFRFSNEAELLENYPEYSIVFPAEKEPRISESLQRCVELSTPKEGARYRAFVTAYDTWGKASKTIVSE